MSDGGRAFPVAQVYETYNRISGRHEVTSDVREGMTLRDYFAAHALIGMLAQPANAANVLTYDDQDNAARWAYGFADAMLKARASK